MALLARVPTRNLTDTLPAVSSPTVEVDDLVVSIAGGRLASQRGGGVHLVDSVASLSAPVEYSPPSAG